ncbi:unnamed protein product [Cunninghamella blakesleeana]
MLMKYNYLLATLFVYLNFISNVFCCSPTTLTIWKNWESAKPISDSLYFLEARLEVRDEGTSEFTKGDRKILGYDERNQYHNHFSNDKRFGLYGAWGKDDLTYTWNGRSQYLEKPVNVQKNGRKQTLTYYGCI